MIIIGITELNLNFCLYCNKTLLLRAPSPDVLHSDARSKSCLCGLRNSLLTELYFPTRAANGQMDSEPHCWTGGILRTCSSDSLLLKWRWRNHIFLLDTACRHPHLHSCSSWWAKLGLDPMCQHLQGVPGLQPASTHLPLQTQCNVFSCLPEIFEPSELQSSCIRSECLPLCLALNIWGLHVFIPAISLFNNFLPGITLTH